MRTIFVGGLHGAGKTQLIEWMSSELGIPYYSAGQLLSDRDWATEGVTSRPTEDLESDQLLVVRRLTHVAGPNDLLILDGHFALSTDSRVTKVPPAFFARLDPVILLLLDTPVTEVRRRLLARDGHAPSNHLLESFRLEEISSARQVSDALRVPLHILDWRDPLSDAIPRVREVMK